MFEKKEKKVVLYFIDDDEFHLKIIQGKFSTSSNYEFYSYKTGEEFLDKLIKKKTQKNIYQIVILDYYLNSNENSDSKNGIEILKIIKEINPSIEVIMLSGMDDVNIVTTAMHYGAITFVKKNENSFTRIQNNINWIISQKDLESKKHSHRITRHFFFIVLGIIAVTALLFFMLEH